MTKISNSPLSDTEIHTKLVDIPGWTYNDQKLFKTFKFKDFRDALTFLVRLGFEAEALNHHPEIHNVYNQVALALNTHDAGGKVTALDFELARRIEKLPLPPG